MITRLALTIALGVIVLSGHPATATASAETCQGQPATIVGQPGADVEGTDGPDIVVTNGAERTSTGTGDDLVCMTGGAELDHAQVSAGEGDDVVDATASQARDSFAALDPGDDTFIGGPGSDHVIANDPWDAPSAQGSDVVSTGAGDDIVESGGSFSLPDHDDIDLGPGRDWMWLQGVVAPDVPIRGGDGVDQIEFGRTSLRRALVIDNSRGIATEAGRAAMAWTGMERFRLSPISRSREPAFIGGAGPERLVSSIALTSVQLGGGDDLVNLHLHGRLADLVLDGGVGHDSLVLNAGAGDQAKRVDLDVPAARLLFRSHEDERMRAAIRGFERYRLSADRLDFRGSRGPDQVEWVGCRGVVDGRGGDDLLKEISIADVGCGYLDEDGKEVVRGGGGDDTLLGSYAPNTLLGGPGDDLADGGGSKRDRCVAETERRCEQ